MARNLEICCIGLFFLFHRYCYKWYTVYTCKKLPPVLFIKKQNDHLVFGKDRSLYLSTDELKYESKSAYNTNYLKDILPP